MATAPVTRHVAAADLVRASGATYRQVDYWTINRILRPVRGDVMPGSGRTRQYPEVEVDVARVVAVLSAAGVTRPVLLVAAQAVRAGGIASGGGWHVLAANGVVTLWTNYAGAGDGR